MWALLRHAWLNTHDIHTVELPVQLLDLASVSGVDDVLVQDLLALSGNDQLEHLAEYFHAGTEQHYPAIVLLLAAVGSHGDMAPLQPCLSQKLLHPGAEHVGICIEEKHPAKAEPEDVDLLKTVVPALHELLVAIVVAVFALPVLHKNQLPASFLQLPLGVSGHALDGDGHQGVAGRVLLQGVCKHDRCVEVLGLFLPSKGDERGEILRPLVETQRVHREILGTRLDPRLGVYPHHFACHHFA
mmetsp:Transcript_1416/g.3586  ORF Transcript_1416/g.3586 Transcript_1416/m.3586 type:complete len:243 (-) Transcript_1416:131-859(-)